MVEVFGNSIVGSKYLKNREGDKSREGSLDVETVHLVSNFFLAVSQDLSPEVCPDIFVV
jgi:hypothetical protein